MYETHWLECDQLFPRLVAFYTHGNVALALSTVETGTINWERSGPILNPENFTKMFDFLKYFFERVDYLSA